MGVFRKGICTGFGIGLILWAGLAGAQSTIDEYPASSGSYSGSYSGNFTATVTQGDRGGGRLGGAVSYSYQFDVPSRPALTSAQCQNNTPVTGPNDCNRSCIKKDSYKRYLTGVLTGVPAISATASCAAPISGTLQNLELTEAYDACGTANAWGGQASSTVSTLVGPLFHFNNPRTHQTTSGGLFHSSTEWSLTNEAELLLPNLVISVEASITCNRRIIRLEDNSNKQDGGGLNTPAGGHTQKATQGKTIFVQDSSTINSDAPSDKTTPHNGRGTDTPLVVAVPLAQGNAAANDPKKTPKKSVVRKAKATKMEKTKKKTKKKLKKKKLKKQ